MKAKKGKYSHGIQLTVPAITLEQHNQHKGTGDYVRIAEAVNHKSKLGIDNSAVRKVILRGKGRDVIVQEITRFYAAKETLQEALSA